MDFLNPYTVIDIPSLELIRNLAIGVILAVVWAFAITKTTRLVVDTRQFYPIFLLLIPSMILIISIIKSSIALSLGLVGALSIVRFRTPIKEPEELLYLFVAIAVGLGLGANQVLPTLIGFAIIVLAMAPFAFANLSRFGANSHFIDITIRHDGGARTGVGDIIEIMDNRVRRYKIKRVSQANAHTEFLIDVPHLPISDLDAIKDDLGKIAHEYEISLMDKARIIT